MALGFAPCSFASPSTTALALEQAADAEQDACEIALIQFNSNPYSLSEVEKNNLILYLSMLPVKLSSHQMEWLIWELENLKYEKSVDSTEMADAVRALKKEAKLLHADKFANWLVYKLSIPQHNLFYEPLRQAKDFKQVVEFFEQRLGWISKPILKDIRPGQYVSFSIDGFTKAIVIPTRGPLSSLDLQKIYSAVRENKFYVSSKALAAYIADSQSYDDLEHRLAKLGKWGVKRLSYFNRPTDGSVLYSKEQKFIIFDLMK